MTQINIKLDDEVKATSGALFKRLGLTMSAAITLYPMHRGSLSDCDALSLHDA